MNNRNLFFNYAAATFFMSLLFYSCSTSKSNTVGDGSILSAIDSNSWTFTALHVRPQVGRNDQTNGVYTVDYIPGTLAVYLPYFGRAFGNVDLSANKSPLDFTTKDFTAEKIEVKSGRYSVIIKPKDQKEVQTLTFTLFSNGSATLNVILTNRTPIAFTGNIAPFKKPKE